MIDIILVIAYTALINRRDGWLALLLFITSVIIVILPITGWQAHLLIASLYCIGSVSRFCRSALAVSLFQLIMAVDAYLAPFTETLLFNLYVPVMVVLNVFILIELGGAANGRNATGGRLLCDRISANIMRGTSHQKTHKE